MLSKSTLRPAPAGLLKSRSSLFVAIFGRFGDDWLAWFTFLLALLAAGLSLPFMSAHAGVGPTVKDVIEFKRIVQPITHSDADLQAQISPDREQAFIVTRQSNVATDVNRFELLWLDVSRKRLSATGIVPPVTLLTVDSRQDEKDLNPSVQDVRWLSNRTIVLRARMNDEPFQVYRLDVPTGQLTQMTYAPFGVLSFDLTPDLNKVLYLGPVPNPAVPAGVRSIVVGTQSFWNVHFGQGGFRNQKRRYQFYVADAQSRAAARPLGDSFAENLVQFPRPSISPDGRWAALPVIRPERVKQWEGEYAQIADAVAQSGGSRKLDPLSYFSTPTHYAPRSVVVYRLSDGAAQAIVDAPDDSTWANGLRTDRLWQRDGQSIVVAGTYLPRSAKDGPADASHIVEYWPEAKRWKDIAVLKHQLKWASPVAGQANAFVVLDGETTRRFEKTADGQWRELTAAETHGVQGGSAWVDSTQAAAALSANALPIDWHLHVQEALNQPPDIVAQGPGGAVVRLTDMNPQFLASEWGTMREYSWKDAKGRTWNGGLMVPKDFDPEARHALVIQTYGFSPTRFYRDGSNTYDGFTSGFPGRALLRENILVLAVPLAVPPPSGDLSALDTGAKVFMVQDGVRAAIDDLVGKGIVDRDRIGIMGWSATGEQVLNMVTFTDIPIRAASMLDGDANTLFSMTITYSVLDDTQVRKEQLNGGGPYGASLQRWIDRDPALHTECVRAAMRIETYGPEVHNNWDEYILMRRQYKPVELIYIPGGAHQLSRPSERMISLQGNVDWYKFWLSGEKRTEVIIPGETATSLNDQYVRWDQMAEMKKVDDKKPRCAEFTSKRQ